MAPAARDDDFPRAGATPDITGLIETTEPDCDVSPDISVPDHFPKTVCMALAPAADMRSAEAVTRAMALSHYENFSVISVLLPRNLRQDFCNIYAFCRTADDLGDELGDRDLSLRWLGRFKRQTRQCFAEVARMIDATVVPDDGRVTDAARSNIGGRFADARRSGGDPISNGVETSDVGASSIDGASSSIAPLPAVFVALAKTAAKHDIPIDPFIDLIDAFEQDQRVTRYDTFEQLVDYCRRSADPVGRLVLYLCGYRDAHRQALSDKTCTALQLTNFWQDVRRDLLDRDRIYLPKDSMDRFGVTESQIRDGVCDENFRRLIRFEVDRAAELFSQGDALAPLLRPAVRKQIELFSQGGRAILTAIRRQGYDTLSRRPKLSRWQKGGLVLSVLTHYATRSLPRLPAWGGRA
jgi:squalene synthase HpnC